MKIVERLLERFAKLLPLRPIHIDGDVYLRRFYIAGRLVHSYFPDAVARLGFLPFTIYLHCFERPDRDRELHNHPWDCSYSLILNGGYIEERRNGPIVMTRVVGPLRINTIGHDDFHRVDTLLADRVWTIFVAGRKVDTWGFWDRNTGDYIPWRAFVGVGDGSA